MIERYYTLLEAASLLQIHPEYVRALLRRLPGVSAPEYRRFGSHPRLVRVIREPDVSLLQKALIRAKPRGNSSQAQQNPVKATVYSTHTPQHPRPKNPRRGRP